MVENRMVYVIGAYKMFECSRSFLGCGFDFVDGNWREGDGMLGSIVVGKVVEYAFESGH